MTTGECDDSAAETQRPDGQSGQPLPALPEQTH